MPTPRLQDIPDKITFRVPKAVLVKLVKESAEAGISPHQLAKQIVEERIALLEIEAALEAQVQAINALSVESATTKQELGNLRADIATTLEALLIASKALTSTAARDFVDTHLRRSR
jgi:uncharacterized coiled-coil protein SlyX